MNKKIISIFLIAIAIFFIGVIVFTSGVFAKTTTDFENEAKKYIQAAEKIGTPITIRYDGKSFYYIPITVNDSITESFPGIMLSSAVAPVTDEEILKELFKYPALVTNQTYSIAKFDDLAAKKTAALDKYCRILQTQEIWADEMNMQANVPGVLYKGIKLAFDAVSLAKTGIRSGYKAFVKALAKDRVQDAILAELTVGDSNDILESTQAAYNNAAGAYTACTEAREAWQMIYSKSGKASPEYAQSAVESLMEMFSFEAALVGHTKNAVERIYNYPRILTKIKESKYTEAVNGLSKLQENLRKEAQSWSTEFENITDEYTRELWALEQIDRTGAGTTAEQQAQEAAPSAAITNCTNVDVSNDYTFYTYTIDSPGTNGPCRNFGNGISGNTVTLTCLTDHRFRNHWVKEIDVSGLDTLNVKADLTIDDRGFFYSLCPNGGVKYDNYSSLSVLSVDPRPVFNSECGKVATQETWPQCGINSSVLGTCGVAKCASAGACDFNVNVAGLDKVYIVFHTANPWPAYVTGTMSNLEICPGP